MKKALHQFLFFLSLACASSTSAQGLIVNEVSNGTGGNQDFVEFLVLGNPLAPTAPVNLSGWIIDDNNGSFGGSTTGIGISNGHIRISPTCLTAVPPGSIIVIYNPSDKNTSITAADDATDSNNDKVYIFSANSSCFQACTSLPSSANPAYAPCTYGTTSATTWANSLILGSTNDAMQTRRPDATFYHGLFYGSGISGSFPSFPTDLGGGTSFKSKNSSTSGEGITASCGAFNSSSTFSVIAASTQTPGAANNAQNGTLIQNIQNGNYNYADPADPNNCVLTLPLYLIDFQADIYNLHRNILTWRLSKVDPNSSVNIQRSEDGITFKTVQQMPLEEYLGERDYNYIDFTPLQTTYYRLEFIEPFGKISYSYVQVVSQKTDATLRLFPNPTNEQLNLALAKPFSTASRCEVIDALGRTLMQTELPADNAAIAIYTQDLPAGNYYLRLSNEMTTIIRPFIKL